MAFGQTQGRAPRSGRRIRLRRKLPRRASPLLAWLREERNAAAVLVVACFALAAGAVVAFADAFPREYVGQRAGAASVNRLEHTDTDVAATAQRQAEARKAAPRIYAANADYVERIRGEIEGLPLLVRDKPSIADLQPATVERYALTEDTFEALRALQDADSLMQWRDWTDALLSELAVGVPIVASAEFDAFSTAARRAVALPAGEDGIAAGPRLASIGRGAIELRPDDPMSMRARLVAEASEAGFPIVLAQSAIAPILADPQPTIAFDPAATKSAADEAAQQAQPVLVTHPRGEALYAPGDVLTTDQVARAHAEHARHRASADHPGIAMPFVAAAAMGLGIGVAAAIFLGIQSPDVFGRWRRLASVLALALLPAVAAAAMAGVYPRAVGFAAVGGALLAAGISTVAFGLRVSLVTVLAQQPLVAAVVPGGAWIAAIAGPLAYAALLREVRHRSTLVTASVAAAFVSAVAVLVGTAAPGAGDPAVLPIAFGDALIALVTALFVGFLMIGLLPTVERVSGHATGLTLVELRDPKHPLLRELQRRAPGTWNHSLQVANIAEAAAESIGADGLLAYVGALYHDIGKINKPEYFVENQTGTNRHDRLSPAMSLLVIVGHVKDGMELAAEFRLPAQVRHFIESHHGTTLMEYFFRAAQKRAGEDEINEADFRYPGPKPASREAAVLMLCDCVESASRTLSEPTPARIEQLVRDLSHRRLVDGQFDDSPLTLRELRTVEDSIIKSLNAIYHGRISYPSLRGEARDGRPLPRVAS